MAGVVRSLGILRRSLKSASSWQRKNWVRTLQNAHSSGQYAGIPQFAVVYPSSSGIFPPTSAWRKRHSTVVSKSPSASKTKAVIFDLGGVVLPSPQGIFDKFEEKWSLPAGSLVDTIKATGNGGSFAKMERGEYSVEDFCEPFRNEYEAFTGGSCKMTLEQVKEFARTLCDFTKVDPHQEVLDIFSWLKERGIGVAILTNNFRHDCGKTVFPEELQKVDVVGIISVCWNNFFFLPF